MIILFEDFFYSAVELSKILPAELLSWSADGEQAKTTFVGYHYCSTGAQRGPVFILPKVFVNRQGPFGRADISRETLIEHGKSLSEIFGDNDAQIVSRLSFWLYLTIARYAEKNPDTVIIRSRNIQEVKSVGEYNCSTLIEVIQSLRKFNRDHKDLFTFIVNNNRSGVHKVNWTKTINKLHPFMQGEEPVYLNFINKKKNINFDEELIVIFYSVLEYLKEQYFFDDPINLHFNLIPTHEIEGILEAEMGTIMLNKIRHKYFTDELVQLWNLLYVFFDKAEKIATKSYLEESVLATSFNNVFEDMIDQLVGSNELNAVKYNKDGKIIDHLYKDNSLINNGNTYYIADSKYYKECSDLGENSVYKQFTYAKNIIQYNLNLFQKGRDYLPSMRDDLTEGYNVVPNFFIRASAVGDGGLYDYENDYLKSEFDTDLQNRNNKLVNYHFPNRLFDRDTLVLQTYNINFLYVLAKYVEGEDDVNKARIRHKFREELISRFDNLYHFYELTPTEGETMESVVEKNFRKLLGKAIRPSADSTSLIFAWEKNSLTATEGQTCEAYLQQLQSVAYTKTSLRKLNESHGNYRPNVNRIGKTSKVHMYNVTADDVLYEMAAETGVDMKK